MENRYDAVIFDWAGTTIDYGCFAPVGAFVETFREYGIEPTLKEVREPMGMLKRDHIKAMLGMERINKQWINIHKREWDEEDIDDMYSVFEGKLLDSLMKYTDVKPHVTEVVDELRKRNIKIGSTTGYTDNMMAIVVPSARDNGYSPDVWFSPDSVDKKGRPYPYMIFKNMETLGIKSVDRVMKVGDTVSDIKEGKAAGVYTVGVIEGSSELGLTKQEYDTMEYNDRKERIQVVKDKFIKAGADAVINNMGDLLELI